MISSKIIIGKKIKILRKQKRFTLDEFAHKLDVDRQYVWKMENGKKNMTFDYLDKVINKLGCTHEDFFNLTDN